MRVFRIAFVVLALFGLIAVAGCGSSDDSDSTSSEALSNEEYAQQIQTVLTDFGSSFSDLGTQISNSDDADQFGNLVDQAEDEIQGAIDDLNAITPPADAQEGHDQMVAALENFSSKLTDVSEAADSGDNKALVQAAQSLQSAAVDFQTDLQQAAQSLQDAGITLDDSSGTSTDSTTG
jgi:hypothetical protein